MTARTAARRITEAEWQDQVIDLAHIHGWLAVHFRPARTGDGWRTPVAADGAGWPDLILVRPRDGRMIITELKTATGRLTPAQKTWIAALRTVPDIEVHVWRPDDLDLVQETLR